MEVTQEQLDEFYALRTQAANNLAKKTLKDNPNVTYGSLLSPKELELATLENVDEQPRNYIVVERKDISILKE